MTERRRLIRESPGDIYVSPDRRGIDREKVSELAKSMASMGLLNPIVIREVIGEVTMADGEVVENAYHLIAGHHRLQAAAILGWSEIDCELVDINDRRARMWEIAENLHRAELTKLEYGEQVAEWIRLVQEAEAENQSAQLAPIESRRADGRGHRPEGGLNLAVRELGIERTEAQRAVKIDALVPEAKAEAKILHLDNNQRALLNAARQPTKEDQLRVLREQQTLRATPKPSSPQSPARDPLNNIETVERQVDALMAVWNRTGPEAREIFINRIDRPIADSMRATRA